MEGSNPDYVKFPARHWKLFGTDRVWFAPDHLLLVVSNFGISEDYKRFYFKDIQAVNVMKTVAAKAKAIVGSVLLLLWAILAALLFSFSDMSVGGTILLVLIGAGLAAYVISRFVRGPSCRCVVYSSVQRQVLSPVKSIKTADRFLEKLVPQIEAVQGKPDISLMDQGENHIQAPEPALASHVAEKPLKQISDKWHWILYLGLLLLSALVVATMLMRSPVISLAETFIYAAVFIINIVAVVKQTGSTLPTSLKSAGFVSLVLMILTVFLGYVNMVYFMFQTPDEMAKIANNTWEMVKYFAQLDVFEYPFLLWVNVFLAASCAVVGIWGVIGLWRKEE